MPDDDKTTDKSQDKSVVDDGVQDPENKTDDKEAEGLGLNQERDAIYGRYYGEEDATDGDDPDQKSDDDDSQNDDHDTDRDDSDKVDTDDDASDKDGDDSDKDDQDQKMVPLAALHEERKKRQEQAGEIKSQTERIETLETRVTQLLKDNTQLLDKLESRRPDDDSDDVDDDELDAHDRAVKKDLEELKRFKKEREEERQREALEQRSTAFKEAVKKVSGELEEEGYYGFEEFGVPLVADKLKGKIAELGEKKALEKYDHGEGWKEIYREEVWPVVSKRFKITPNKEEEEKADKLEQKKKAKLPNRPKAPGKGKTTEDDDLSQEEMFSDYIKRRKSQLFD